MLARLATISTFAFLSACSISSPWKSSPSVKSITGENCQISFDELYKKPVESNSKSVCGHMSVEVRRRVIILRRLYGDPKDDDILQVVFGYPYIKGADALEPGQIFNAYVEGKADVFVDCFDTRPYPQRKVESCVPFSRPVQIWATRFVRM